MLKNRIETLIWRAAQHRVALDRAIENLLEVVLVDERVVSSFICRISRAVGELASVRRTTSMTHDNEYIFSNKKIFFVRRDIGAQY